MLIDKKIETFSIKNIVIIIDSNSRNYISSMFNKIFNIMSNYCLNNIYKEMPDILGSDLLSYYVVSGKCN